MRVSLVLAIICLISCDGIEKTTISQKICGHLIDESSSGISIENNWKHVGIGRTTDLADCKPVDVNDILVEFRSDGTIRGTGSCNSFFSDYSASAGKMEIVGFGVTEKLCGSMEDPIMVWEKKFLSSYQDISGYEIHGNSLQLKTNNGVDLFFILIAD